MTPGTRYVVPEGYMFLPAGSECYLLAHQRQFDRVLLVMFTCNRRMKIKNSSTGPVEVAEYTYGCRNIQFSVNEFDSAISNGNLVPAPDQDKVPPHLISVGTQAAPLWVKRKLTPEQSKVVKFRHKKIKRLVDGNRDILLERDPFQTMRKHANASGLNAQRVVLWTVSYLLFGRQLWVLAPQWGVNNAGAPEFSSSQRHRKTGRHSALGRNYGYPMTPELRRACVKGYDKYQGLHVCMTTIYIDSLEDIFEADVTTNDYGDLFIYQKERKPFPTLNQFRYAIEKHYSKARIQLNKLGHLHTRNDSPVDAGSYAELTPNVYSKISTDGCYSKHFPVRFDGEQTERVCTVIIVDYVSGMPLGVGMGVGAESGVLYRAALFCCAIPKKQWFALFGHELKDESYWPAIGLPPRGEHDRLVNSSDWEGVEIADLTPSRSGKSKAMSEAAHPRSSNKVEEAIHLESTLNPQQLIVALALHAVEKAQGGECETARHPECIEAGVVPTPVSYFNWMVETGRTDADQITFEEAVRRYLEPVQLKATKRGVKWNSRHYVSNWVRESDEYRALARNSSTVDGYYLSACLRYIWVETSTGLEQLQAYWKHSAPAESADMTITGADAYDDQVQTANAVQRRNKTAIQLALQKDFRRQTGKSMHKQNVKRGAGNSAARKRNSKPYTH